MIASRIKALIVDDEPPARRKILRFLERDPEVEVVGQAGNAQQAIAAIQDLRPDVVFLDVQMGKTDGFGVLEALEPAHMPEIVFVTAHDDYALKAFEVAAVDYLLKPFDADRFAQALQRAKSRFRSGSDAALASKLDDLLAQVAKVPRRGRRILARARGRSVPVKIEDIVWIQAAGNYVELHVGGAEYLLRETLEGIVQRLDKELFLRVHRSFVVNAEHIREIRRGSHGDHTILMGDGAKIRLSRRYRDGQPESMRKHL